MTEQHERAFAECKGLEKNRAFRNLLLRRGETALDLLDADLRREILAVPTQGNGSEVVKARASVVEARAKSAMAEGRDGATEARRELDVAEAVLEEANRRTNSQIVRTLEVYEHPRVLEDAVASAGRRLLIVSPWIRGAVVTPEFVGQLKSLLRRGVRLYVGYGLGDRGRNEDSEDRRARLDLEKMADEYPAFVMRHFGDTHAKVLIKDDEFFVTSSFNWLSFRGDPNRTFREEWGTLVAIPALVNKLFERMVTRFGSTAQHSGQ